MGVETYDIKRARIWQEGLIEGGEYSNVTLLEAEERDLLLYGMTASNSDTSAAVLTVHLEGVLAACLVSAQLAAGVGYAGVAPVDLMALMPANLQTRIVVSFGNKLALSLDAEPGSGKGVTVVAFGGEL